MDPNANLAEQQWLLTCRRDERDADDRLVLRELRAALRGWLDRGGFAPDWTQYPQAAKYYGH